MHASHKSFSLWLGLGVLGAGTAYAAQVDTTIAGWTPLVTMWGEGDTKMALGSLDKITKAYETFLHKTEIDKPTQKFIDKAFKEFENFDLEGFHDILPDEAEGGARELNVRGELSGGKYLISQAAKGSKYEVGLNGPRNGLAESSLLIHGKQRETDDFKSLKVKIRWGLGIGPLSYTSLLHADRDLTRLVTTGDAHGDGNVAVPSDASRSQIKKTNPGLGAEDIDALATLFEAYPALATALMDVGRIEDLRTAESDSGYFHVTTRMRAEPDRIKEKYPAFAKHIKNLDEVLHADVRVVDDQGRNIVKLTIDSDKLLFGVEAYIKDGLPLPFDNGQVYENEPLNPTSDQLKNPKVLINARIDLLGIVINMRDMQVDASYAAKGSYATADATITKMPKIKVDGRALGLVPPGFLDVFIPSNIEDITKKFFNIAVKGNDGKGITVHIDLGGKAPGANGVLAVTAGAEVYESFLVKMAGGIVTDRLMMSETAEDQAKDLFAALHDAFVKDLARFSGKVDG